MQNVVNLHNFTRGAAINANRLRELTDDQMRRNAPSIFATEAHESRSDRYTYIPTINVVDALRKEGFVPVEAKQGNSRIPGKADFTKHMIKFVLAGGQDLNALAVGDSIPQVCLVNSHDGTSGYNLFAGLYRLMCSNGLMVCDSEFDAIRVRHSGNIAHNVIEGSFEVIDQAKRVTERVQDWRGVMLEQPEQEIFARNALALRFDDADKAPPVTVSQVLRPRRTEDTENNLWNTFNRVQEHLVKGGNRYRTANGRLQTTRAVKGIDADTSLNRALWRLADEMRALKVAA